MQVVSAVLELGGREFDAGRPAVMAIVNRTPDSFYAANRFVEMDAALEAVGRAVDAGADIVDVGAVRAGQEGEVVTAEMEVDRLEPFLRELRRAHPRIILSVDTWRSEVLAAIGGLGVDLVNDTWAGHDPALVTLAADLGAAVVCSHTGGLAPRTDPVGVTYPPEPDGVVEDVLRTLRAGAERAEAAGVPPQRILVDPTLDFGKTTTHSLTVLRSTDRVCELGYPVLQAISRKDFVGETLSLEADDRLSGSLAATAVAAWLGAAVFRTHDVRETRHVVDMVASIKGVRPPDRTDRGR